jgi:hypothetical protein
MKAANKVWTDIKTNARKKVDIKRNVSYEAVLTAIFAHCDVDLQATETRLGDAYDLVPALLVSIKRCLLSLLF